MESERDRAVRPTAPRAVSRPTRPVAGFTMSEANARRSAVILEKTVITDFLKLYRSCSCLWDQKNMMYGNKEARENAYELLLEKYKLIDPNAGVIDVKKKIEYMRCAYRREHKKVIKSQLQGREPHKPHLWYYDLLTFLNEHDQNEYEYKPITLHLDDSYQEQHVIEDSEEETPKPKRRKEVSNSYNPIYIDEISHNDEENVAIQGLYDQEQDQQQSYIVSNEAEAFGRTVGFQLKELSQLQRIYAEKLISDVIFQARLGSLNRNTALVVTSDDGD